jgi:hypothetical protein
MASWSRGFFSPGLCTYIGLLHVKYRVLLSDCDVTGIYRRNFEKSSYINFHKNTSVGRDGQTDMVKLIAAFHIFCEEPKNCEDTRSVIYALISTRNAFG